MPNPSHVPHFIIKVCGVTTYDDAQAALDAGANALGFNFYTASPRFIQLEQAAGILSKLRGDFLRVGVFVNPLSQTIAQAAPVLDVAQIHGAGDAPLPIWRAVTAGTIPPPDAQVQAWLLDSVAAKRSSARQGQQSPSLRALRRPRLLRGFTTAFGGSGKTFDWSLAAAFPYPAIVAGGLDAHNVAEAIRIANPWGVDSCSRLESSPGRKDHARVAAFVATALAAFHARQTVTI